MQPSQRLNLFQRMMLRWRALHPYNPVHVVRVPAALELPRLREIIAARLQAAGLSGLVLDERAGRIAWRGGTPTPVLEPVPPLPTPQQALVTAIERAFNQPFDPGDEPFRFFVIDVGSAFQLALAYDHYVAGGDAIAQLLTDIALAYLGAADTAHAERRTGNAHTYRHLLVQHPGWAWLALRALPRIAAGGRQVSRVPQGQLADPYNGFAALCLTPEQTRAMLEKVRAWGVTFNDLLLATMLLLLSPRAAARRQHPRRNQLAVASIINIRRDFDAPATTWPAPCLAGLRVQHAVPEGIGLQQLARDVHAQTKVMKRDHSYLQSLLGLGLSAMVWRWLAPRHRQAWFCKHYPIWAGVTTLNVNPQWQASGAATARLDYLRAVPTGPLSPLVLAVTTAHDRLHLGIAYRRGAYSAAEVDALAEGLRRSLGQACTEASK